MKRTPEQLQAIEASEPNLVIHAGAGAGKTDVLVQRYLRHVVDDGVGPEKILAITFTRKAAADMKQRIVVALQEAGLSDQARIAQVGPISTIHSFCERILREYPFDAGVDPKFDVLDEYKARDLLRACAKRAIANPRSLSECTKSFVRQASGKNRYGTLPEEAAAALISWIGSALQKLRTAGRTPADLQPFVGSPERVLDAWAECLRAKVLTETGAALPGETWCDADAIRLCFTNAKCKKPPWLPKTLLIEEETAAAELCAGLTELVYRAWFSLLEELSVNRVLDFNELEARTVQLLETNSSVIHGKYEFVMVDEAQDLNPVQHRILRSIPTNNLLLVGDPQQSIYGFRGAERQLFIEQMSVSSTRALTTNFRSTSRILKTVESIFRGVWAGTLPKMTSRNGILGSDACQHAQAQEDPPIEIWRVPDYQPDEHIATGVRALYEEGTPLQNIAILVRNSTNIDALVRGLTRNAIHYSIVPGVGRNYFLRSEIYDLASALQAAADPTDDLALLSLLRSPLVGLTLDAVAQIALVANRRGVTVWQALRTDTPELCQEDAHALKAFLSWFEPLSHCADRLPAWHVLSEVFAATTLDARLALMRDKAQLIANSRRLLTIAIERHDMGPMEFAAWIHSQQQMRTDWADAPMVSEDSQAVRISTIHRAKGLEWDTVVLAAAHRIKDREPEEPIVPSFIPMPIPPPTSQLYKHFIWRMAVSEHALAERDEELRLLYVALTRAKSKLAIAVSGDKRSRWSELILSRLAPNWNPLEGVVIRDLRDMTP